MHVLNFIEQSNLSVDVSPYRQGRLVRALCGETREGKGKTQKVCKNT